jgi:Putative adhesin
VIGPPQHRWLVATFALVALACVGCQPVQVNGSGGSSQSNSGTNGSDGHVDTSSYSISQTVGEINLEGQAGNVDVVVSDGPISVTETARYSDDKPPTSHTVNGTTLTLTEGECQQTRMVNGRCQVDWEIHAPAGTNLTLRSGSGDITVTGFASTVSAKTGSGNVKADRLAGREITAESSSGNVNLTFAQPPNQVTASSSSGDVDLTFAQPPNQVTASSSSGDVGIKVPGGTGYDVQARSSTEDPDVSVTQDNNSPHKIEAKTSSGSIKINKG